MPDNAVKTDSPEVSDRPEAQAGVDGEVRTHLVPVRRSVKYVPFLATGAIIGFVLGSLYGRFGPDGRPLQGSAAGTVGEMVGGGYSALTGIAYLGALGALVGLLVAAIVAIALDRRR